MSTVLKSSDDNIGLTRFWGGKEDGTMVQVTVLLSDNRQKVTEHSFGAQFVELTREQAGKLAQDLLAFANENEVEDY